MEKGNVMRALSMQEMLETNGGSLKYTLLDLLHDLIAGSFSPRV
jgi:hypothetical protein